jgi:RecB family exonuclease
MKLSYSSVSTYRNCPLSYKFYYVDWLPTLPRPALSFGQSIHAALRDFYQEIKELEEKGNSLSPQTSFNPNPTLPFFKPPPLEKLLFYFRLNWSSEGYESKEKIKEAYARGEEILKVYYEENKNSFKAPLAIEERFEIQLDGFLLTGVIDRIDLTPEGLEIIDYKTGQFVPSEEEIKSDLQLPIYHLAAERIDREWREKPHKLTLYFLNPSSKKNKPGEKPKYKYSFSLEDEEVKKVEEILYQTLREIQRDKERNHFEARPNKFCSWCDFKIICPEKSDLSGEEREKYLNQLKRYKSLKGELEKLEKELKKLEKRL